MSVFLPGTAARSYDETRDLSPWSVEQYLSLSGWRQVELEKSTFAIWETADESASLLLPYDKKLRDFSRRYREALDTLTGLTGLEGESLALEIVAARKDVFLLRADQMTVDGSIPFLEAQRLIDGVQTLLTSAAATSIRPRASTAGNKPAAVNEFMREDVRMGHTMHGSFVITVLASDAADDRIRRQRWERKISGGAEEPDLRATEEQDMTSFPRQVMSTLATGLKSAQAMLNGSASTSSIDEAIASGVTLQMLESVQTMAKSEGLHALDLAFKWAKSEPMMDDIPSRIELTRNDTEDPAGFIERFSKKPDVETDFILGQVVRLERSEGSEDGQVVIDGIVGKSRRRVKVPLSGDDYKLAIAAHEASQPVTVTGTFMRNKRGWRMEDAVAISQARLNGV